MRTDATGGEEFLVHWMGYSHEQDSWEKKEDITASLVTKYKLRRHAAEEKAAAHAALDEIELFLQRTAQPQQPPQQPENDPNSMAEQQSKEEVSILVDFATHLQTQVDQATNDKIFEVPRTPKRRPSNAMPGAPRKKRRRRQHDRTKCPSCNLFVPNTLSV